MRDTRHLSLIEHGAYTVLLDHYYATGKPLEADSAALYRICGAQTDEERKAITKIADQFFPVNGDGMRHNKRADSEMVRMAEHNKRLSEAGRRGGQARLQARLQASNDPGFKPGSSISIPISISTVLQPDPQPQPEAKGDARGLTPPTPPTPPVKVKTFKTWSREDLEASVNEANSDGILSDDEAQDFIDCWMEPSASGRSRMSLQKTWDTRRRMLTGIRIVYEKQRKAMAYGKYTKPSRDDGFTLIPQ